MRGDWGSSGLQGNDPTEQRDGKIHVVHIVVSIDIYVIHTNLVPRLPKTFSARTREKTGDGAIVLY